MTFDAIEFKTLLESIRSFYGYDFTEYAEASVKRRIVHFMATKKLVTLADLGKKLLDDEQLFEIFIQEVSVTVTEMFRDPSFYNSLRKNVIKRLATYPFAKIWIAGCATGEEVYSIAIILHEAGLLNRCIIYATDINQKSLQIAKDGVYPAERMKIYTENYQKAGGTQSFSDYYTASHDLIIFNRWLKDNIVFSAHNLSIDKSFNEFQLIICRNVLIYFNRQLQNKVVDLFYESLCSFGVLGLGNKESLLFADSSKYFQDLDRKEKIYIKK